MVWLGISLLSGVVAAVGAWRGSPAALASTAIPAIAGVLFGLVMYRGSTLYKSDELGQRGGWPLRLAGALALTSALAATVEAGSWLLQRRGVIGPVLVSICVLGFPLIAITALRLSVDSPKRRHFYALAAAAAVNAIIATMLAAGVLFDRSTPVGS